MQALFPEIQQRLADYEALPWEALPDLGLYMDQVITFVERQLDGFRALPMDRILTPAMVNNYVKMKLIPRPAGKKYGREQLALLLMVCQLKRACPIEQIARLFRMELSQRSVRELYETFCQLERSAMDKVGSQLEQPQPPEEPGDYALRIAVEAGTLCHVVQSLLSMPEAPEIEPQEGP